MSETGCVVRIGDEPPLSPGDFAQDFGEKGARLVELSRQGLPIPAGFVISASACRTFLAQSGQVPEGVKSEIVEAIQWMEAQTGKRFGDPSSPLLVSVRSGGMPSMQGIVQPLLNIGMNDDVAVGLAESLNNGTFAYENYRRLVQAYATGCLDMAGDMLAQLVERAEESCDDDGPDGEQWKALVEIFKRKIFEHTNKIFPQDPYEQLWDAISAVFRGWHDRSAVMYRNVHGDSHETGTSVLVQVMVFGDLGSQSATGVAFTRDPNSGERRFYGEWLPKSQGGDVSMALALPQPLNHASGIFEGDEILEEVLPDCYSALVAAYEALEKTFRDFLVIEFTVEEGQLWLLQVQEGKKSPTAEIRMAVDMVEEGLISKSEAILRVQTTTLEKLLHPRIDPGAKMNIMAQGLGASPGAATGRVAFSSKDAMEWAGRGLPVILVLNQSGPDDVHGMQKSQGILTARGGITSHAAVVARGMSRTCIVGCTEIEIDFKNRCFYAGDVKVRESDVITLDGVTGSVMLGAVATIQADASDELLVFMDWLDGFSEMAVYANADTARDCEVALGFGAGGVGLCRTEHMFFEESRIQVVREMILAADEEGRRRALRKILPMQKGDFIEIFRCMAGRQVTVRLLDPPLHEFLPRGEADIEAIAQDLNLTTKAVMDRVRQLEEVNPMLGHRGCRVGLTFPEVYEMQVRAIMEAACDLVRDEGLDICPEIMVPLVGHVRELELLRDIVTTTATRVMAGYNGVKVEYRVGTMIELPRACITADEIAPLADFFSFGTNDLTQTVFGVSRDDCGRFLPFYVEMGILPIDPFVSIDPAVAVMVEMAVEKGRRVNPTMKMGICGEHAGEPASVRYCYHLKLDYVSCSPFRVPIARLAAAHAALEAQ